MKAIYIILIVLVFLALTGLALATFVNWQPITDQTKGVISSVGAFLKNVPASLYAGGLGACTAIVGIGKTISNKLNTAKSATVKAQTEYQNLQGQATQVIQENQTLQDTVTAKDQAITTLNSEKEALTTKTKTLEDNLSTTQQSLHDKGVAMQAQAEQKLAVFTYKLPGDSVITDGLGNTIKTVTQTVVK